MILPEVRGFIVVFDFVLPRLEELLMQDYPIEYEELANGFVGDSSPRH